ncbi:MAG: hypothetical protein ACREAW_08155 [Nitrososphaera sp.]
MSNNSFSEKKWKYLSFALIGILAVGSTISFLPQASAHITSNVNHMLEHIYNFVDGIEAKTNNLPADPASNTVVNTRASQTSVDAVKAKTDSMLELREFHDSAFDITTSNPFVFQLICDDTYVVHSVSYSTSIHTGSSDDWNTPQFERGGHSLGLHGLSLQDPPAGTAPFEIIPFNIGLDEFGTGTFEVTLSKSADGEGPDFASVAVVITVASDASCELV